MTPPEPPTGGRPTVRWWFLARVATVLLLVAAVARSVVFLLVVPRAPTEIGLDYGLYMEATRRWLAGGPFYPAWQLAGPYTITPYFSRGEILYPPNALPLFAVFTYLPAIVWWVVPFLIVVAALVRLRPAAWAHPLIAFLVLWPRTGEMVIVGNPAMWCVAAVAAGAAWGWPGAFTLIKPSLFPFAAMGSWRRGWWVALAAMLLVTLPFAYLWSQWLTVVTNASNGAAYNLNEFPTMMIGVVAWIASPAVKKPRLTFAGRSVQLGVTGR